MLKDADRFFKVFSGIPFSERKMPIVVIEDKSINWELAKEEITNETVLGEKILKLMIELKII